MHSSDDVAQNELDMHNKVIRMSVFIQVSDDANYNGCRCSWLWILSGFNEWVYQHSGERDGSDMGGGQQRGTCHLRIIGNMWCRWGEGEFFSVQWYHLT